MSDNPNNNEQPKREAPRQSDAQVDECTDPLQLVPDRARHYIRDLPRRVQDLSPPQRALLTNCNNALRLDRPHPVVAPTTDAALRRAPAIEAPARGGNYVNAEYYPLYETADIMRALNEEGADQPISSLRELAAFCQ